MESSPRILTKDEILDWLRPVQDPEMHTSIVDLGLVYEAEMSAEGVVTVAMTLTSPACPAGDYIVQQMKDRMRENPNVKEVKINLVWEPKWNPVEMASDQVKEAMGLW